MALDVRCPNCGTSFAIGENGTPVNPNTVDGVGYLAPTVIRNENKGEKTEMGNSVVFTKEIDFGAMTNEEKAEILKKMGFNPFDVMNAKADVTGNVANDMYANGYVKNQKLHRRFIAAHTLKLLGWTNEVTRRKCYWSHKMIAEDKWTDNLNRVHDYMYQFRMLKEELRVISILQKSDEEAFNERVQFFNVGVAKDLMDDYIYKLEKQLKTPYLTRVRHCKKIPYIRVRGCNVFMEDIGNKIIEPLRYLSRIIKDDFDYVRIHNVFCRFMKNEFFIALDRRYDSKCPAWVDAFKGAGAYYTMDNLVKYSGLKLVNYDTEEMLSMKDSLEYLKKETSESSGERYRLLALLKNSLDKNDFHFAEAIRK